MRIGVPREIKVHEYRVGLVPAGVRELTAAGHEVLIESAAGNGIGVDDDQFRAIDQSVEETDFVRSRIGKDESRTGRFDLLGH